MLKKVNAYFLLYFIVVIGFITFPPTLKLVNKIEPIIFGIPFLQVVIVLDAVLVAVGLILWLVIEERLEKKTRVPSPLGEEVKM